MEHRKTGLLLITTLLLLAGCRHALDRPEEVDPIYSRIHGKVTDYEKQIEGEEGMLKLAKDSLLKADLTAGERNQLRKEIEGRNKKLIIMTQDLVHAQIQEKERAARDREEYARRFEKNLPWPDSDEIAEFEAHEKLLEARGRKWEDTVPKLTYGPEKELPKAEKVEKPREAAGE